MVDFVIPTDYAGASRNKAIGVLVIVGLTAVFFLWISLSPLKNEVDRGPNPGPGDVDLYNAEIKRMQAGEGFYAVCAEELRTRGYPTRSVFNWRTPAPLAIVGCLPDARLGNALLGVCGLAMAGLAYGWMCRELGRGLAVLGMLALTGVLVGATGEGFVMTELWSGVLVALSVAAYAQQRPRLGVVAGLAALFCRELAAPYCLLCLAMAAWERRWREAAVWLAGFVAYAAYYAIHLSWVLPLIRPDDLTHHHSWLAYGGGPFVLSTAQMNAYLLEKPQWLTALLLPIALVGAASWSTPGGTRLGLTVAGYALAFDFVGLPFNVYWGLMISPLLAIATVRGIAAIDDLLRAVRRLPRRQILAGAASAAVG